MLDYEPDKGVAQRRSYSHIETERSDLAPDDASQKALAVARELGWDVLADTDVDGERTLEATATTFWFGFIDDVVVRIRPDGGGSLVDVRSASRIGSSDLGANARRVDAFMARFRGG